MNAKSLVLTTMLLAAPAITTAQMMPPVVAIAPDGVTQELHLTDGTRLIGRVASIEEGQLTFRTTSGREMKIDVTSVKLLKPFNGRIVNGDLWEEDPNTTRLFFGPTGRSLKRGEAYFGVYEIFMPFVQVGVTDRLSIGGGTPLVFGEIGHPFWVTPKLQVVNAGRTSASIGVIHFHFEDTNAGIAYGVVTHGGADAAFTIGAGYAYANEDHDQDAYSPYPYYQDDSHERSPVLMIGGEKRTSKRTKLVTENYVFNGGGIASLGFRFFGEKLSADFAMMVPLNTDEFIAFPMINIVRKF